MEFMYTRYCIIPPQLNCVHGRAETSKQYQIHFCETHVKFSQ